MHKLSKSEKRKRGTLKSDSVSTLAGTMDSLPSIPAHLRDAGANAFNQACSDLLNRCVLRHSDTTLIEQYATAVQTADDAQRLLSAEGIIYEDKNGQARRHPAFTVWRSAVDTARQLASRLTITPYDRARTPEVEREEQTAVDPFDKIRAMKYYREHKMLPTDFVKKYNLDPLLGVMPIDKQEFQKIMNS
jgi:P27 family predicted phage terminase small subunit